MLRALTGLSLSASSVGSRPAVHAPITHENEQGPGGHRARLRVMRTMASRLRKGGSEVGESTRGLDGMSLWVVWGRSRRVGEASLTATMWEKWWGSRPRSEYLPYCWDNDSVREQKRPSQLPYFIPLVLHMRWLSEN